MKRNRERGSFACLRALWSSCGGAYFEFTLIHYTTTITKRDELVDHCFARDTIKSRHRMVTADAVITQQPVVGLEKMFTLV